MHTP
jgi:hypothetical protein